MGPIQQLLGMSANNSYLEQAILQQQQQKMVAAEAASYLNRNRLGQQDGQDNPVLLLLKSE